MDFKRIFLKEACPTSIGGQAILEGVMMQGETRTAAAIRLPDERIYLKTWNVSQKQSWRKLPLIRGVVSFFKSLVFGMKMITFSADVAEYFAEEPEEEEPQEGGRVYRWFEEHIGEQGIWNLMLGLTILVSLVLSIGIFIVLPTAVVSWLKPVFHHPIILNLVEGVLRIAMFVAYIAAISKMKDIRRTFEYHGAEHKSIHCFENGLELKPENARDFYTLHPRCGTSFLMFVMVVSLVLFSLLGWPNLAVRIASRILLLPVVAGCSYELLRWAGKSSNRLIEIISIPGLLLQKLTTREPDDSQVEIAMTAMKAVLKPGIEPEIEGICNNEAEIIQPMMIER